MQEKLKQEIVLNLCLLANLNLKILVQLICANTYYNKIVTMRVLQLEY